jgi:hypothetical protein
VNVVCRTSRVIDVSRSYPLVTSRTEFTSP